MISLLLLLVTCSTFLEASTWTLDLYEHEFHQGAKLQVTIYEEKGKLPPHISVKLTKKYPCYQLPRDWWDRVSSIDTHGYCVWLYSSEDCSSDAGGTPVQFSWRGSSPDNIAHENFVGSRFNNNARSYSPC